MVFFMELARFFSLFYLGCSLGSSLISFITSFGAYFGTYFGGSLGCGTSYFFVTTVLELFGGILFCEFLGSRTCFIFCCPPLIKVLGAGPLLSYFLIAFAL